MNDADMVEQKPAIPTTEARSLLAPRSLLAQVVETQVLPEERFSGEPRGVAVDIKKIGETVAILRKNEGHFEAEIYDGRGRFIRCSLDPSTSDIVALNLDYDYVNLREYGKTNGIEIYIGKLGFSNRIAEKTRSFWLSTAPKFFNSNQGFIKLSHFKDKNLFLPVGDWHMGVVELSKSRNDTAFPMFVFTVDNDWFYIDPSQPQEKAKMATPTDGEIHDIVNRHLITLKNDIRVLPGETILAILDKGGKEFASYPGFDPTVDPSDPQKIYFINTGRIYSLDASDAAQVANRAVRPIAEAQINVDNPQEIEFDPNGNFIIIRSSDNKLSIVDKESGDVVKTFDGVRGPVLIDRQGDITYVDTQNRVREIQTNFQAIPQGGSESAQRRREEELKQMQERFANLELGKIQKQKGSTISEEDVASTLRQAISRQIDEPLNTATTAEAVEDILDRLQGFKAEPTNQAYGEVVDEFISRARDKLSGIRTGEFDAQLNDYQKALDDVKSVGDTIGLDEQFAKLLELRGRIDITDPQKRREIEQRLRTLQTQKDTLTTQYQGELIEAANQTLPQLEQLVKETGSPQELGFFSTSTQAQQFEMMLANIKDPLIRKELRDRYQAIKAEQRTKLEEVGRQLGEQERQRWAQVVDEAREDLASLQAQIEQLSDTKEIDRFGRHPLVTAWRAKLFALPSELREVEEKRLEIILGARKKDMEHRKELGAVGEAGELKFGNATFSIYKEPPRIWQPKFLPRKGGFAEWVDLVFEDSQGRIWRPEEHDVVVSSDLSDERTQRMIERYRRQADEYFRGIKRRVPEFDEHWRITEFHMGKLEEIAEALNLQLLNHRGILILQGEAGTGKNVLIDMLANLSNREVVPILCNENSVKEDLTYEFYYDPEKGTYKLPSKLVEGSKTPGTIILFDEINALKPGIAKMMNSLFDYRRRIYLPEGGREREIITDPTVLFVGTMNPQNYAGVNRLSPEVKSRARVVDLDYPPFEEPRSGRTYWRSDEAEMLAAYMDDLSELKQDEFKLCWDYVINSDTSNGADRILGGNPQIETDIRSINNVIRVANRLREMYEAYQTGDSNEPMDFPTSLREVTDVVMEMNHRRGVKPIIKRVIIPKIDDRRQKRLVEQTIDAVLPS